MIISIAGPSGVGKSTLADGIFKAIPDARPLESVTTRKRRESEAALGESTYVFVNDEEFQKKAESGEFLWQVQAYGNKYGTRKAAVDAALREGVFVTILVLDAVEALHAYARENGMSDAVKWLYLELVDEAEFVRRLSVREEPPEEIGRRTADYLEWNRRARSLDVPFHFLDASKPREEVLADALAHVRGN